MRSWKQRLAALLALAAPRVPILVRGEQLSPFPSKLFLEELVAATGKIVLLNVSKGLIFAIPTSAPSPG